jgi:hypothetical protein
MEDVELEVRFFQEIGSIYSQRAVLGHDVTVCLLSL